MPLNDSYVGRALKRAEVIYDKLAEEPDGLGEQGFELIEMLGDESRAVRQGVLNLMKRVGAQLNRSLIESFASLSGDHLQAVVLAAAELNRWSSEEIKDDLIRGIATVTDLESARAVFVALRILDTARSRELLRSRLEGMESIPTELLFEFSKTRDAPMIPFVLNCARRGKGIDLPEDVPFFCRLPGGSGLGWRSLGRSGCASGRRAIWIPRRGGRWAPWGRSRGEGCR